MFSPVLALRLAPVPEQRVGHDGGRLGDGDARSLERGDLVGSGAFSTGDDGSRVTHATAGRRGGSGDEGGDGLPAIRRGPRGGLLLGVADRRRS